MRPVLLQLQAFGSYAGPLRVDFARLSRHGIFAISGPTGAGKSTIFDALVYALYDDLPGFRVDGNVRSQFADPSTPTSVALDFVVHGELWRVERRPTQLLGRAGGRGTGRNAAEKGSPVERKSVVVLGRVGHDGELVPDTVLTKKSEVKLRIDALVGLTKDQFEQVVLIPQGRFEEMLKADTQKRAPLLRRLFPVELFTRVTESLKSIASERQAELERAGRAYDALVERLRDAYDAAVALLPDEVRAEVSGSTLDKSTDSDGGGPDGGGSDGGGPDGGGSREEGGPRDAGARSIDSEGGGSQVLEMRLLDRHVEALRVALGRVDGLVVALSGRAETARARLDVARRAADDWDRWQADLDLSASFEEEEHRDAGELVVLDRARRLADLCGALAKWQEATRQLGALEPELAPLVEAVESAWPGELDAAAWTAGRRDAQEAGLLAARLAADARRLDGETVRFARLVETDRSLGDRKQALGQRRIELAERALKLDAEEQALALVTDEVRSLQAEASALDAHIAAVGALEREHQTALRRAGAVADVERLDAELAAATSAAGRAVERAESVRTAWRDGLAGRLAQLLEDGVPCPTCGALEHPAPAAWSRDRADVDDAALDDAERTQDEAIRRREDLEHRVAGARGAIGALDETRPPDLVGAELAASRNALLVARDSAERLVIVEAEERRRRSALLDAREGLGSDVRSLDADAAHMDAEASAHVGDVEEFVADHGAFESPAPSARARASLADDVAHFARVLRDAETLREMLRHCDAVIQPVARALDAKAPGELLAWVLDPVELEARSVALEGRRSRRADVRRRIADYEARSRAGTGTGTGPGTRTGTGALSVSARVRPDVETLEALAESAASEHDSLVGRRAVLVDRVGVLANGPAEVAAAARSLTAARVAVEQAKTVADRCAGLGGGPAAVRLSLENWVLADYLRQVLVQANHRLDAMTNGRFALELCDGVTDGRKAWGLDLAVFDANTGQVRPATTLSGGETFMAALALALGLADVVSGGSNREMGALFVDEGFGSLDAQSLDAVLDVLRSLEDGGRIVGVISHVRELQQALPSGITVEPSAAGSVATVHYPPD